jgi:N-acetylmuramoyl-L-alanine amidase
MIKIALDAGHGLYTAGKRCLKKIDESETREWFLNDRIADKLEELLIYYDCSVLRVDDTTGNVDISLTDRCKMANNWSADVYISIHHNAGVNGGVGGGIEVYYYGTSAERKRQAKSLYNMLIKYTGLVGNRNEPVKNSGFYVIKNTKMPAFLIENGFMDSVTDTPVILTNTHATQTAQGILDFLIKEFGLKKKDNIITNKFVDIKDHYAEKDIADLFEMGIIRGVDEKHFKPDEPIKRADVAIIARNVIRHITGK